METEILHELIVASYFSACATAIALALRNILRALFGSVVAYYVWLMVPIASLAIMLPVHGPTPSYLALVGVALPLSRRVGASIGSSDTLTDTLALWTWAAGACSALMILLWQQARFVRGLTIVARRNGILYAQHVSAGPLVVGILHPQIVLPLDFEDRYAPSEQEVVIAHERTHVQRGDPIANAVCALVRCIFWFNPLVHFAITRFRFDQELACDEAVIRHNPMSQRSYATAMLKIHLPNAELPLACHWPSRHPLRVRIIMLKRPPLPGARRAVGTLVTGLAVIAIGYGAWAAQPGQPGPNSTPSSPRSNPSPGDTSIPGVMHDNRSVLLARTDARADSSVLVQEWRANTMPSRPTRTRTASLAVRLAALPGSTTYVLLGLHGGVADIYVLLGLHGGVADIAVSHAGHAVLITESAKSALLVFVSRCKQSAPQERLTPILVTA